MTPKILPLSKGGTLAYRDHGAGEPLVLIHGVGMQAAAWEPQIVALSQSYRVIALDMPGHGQSAPLPTDSRLEDFVDWCHDALNTLDLGAVNLVGHSMGALIAAGCAITHPKLLLRVALLNSVYERDEISSAAVITRAAAIRDGHVDFATPLSRWFSDAPTDDAARNHVTAWLKAMDVESYATAYAAFAHGDATYADRFNEISCPFLALTGADDQNSTAGMSAAMAQRVPGGKAVVIPKHRHMVNLTAPEDVNAHLRAWLKLPVTEKELQ